MKTKLLIAFVLIVSFMFLPFAVGCSNVDEENGCKLPERNWVEAQEGLIFFRFLPRLVSGDGGVIGRDGEHSEYYVINSQEQLDAIQIRLNVDGGYVYVPLRSTAILSDWLWVGAPGVNVYQSRFFENAVLIFMVVPYGSLGCPWNAEFHGLFLEHDRLYSLITFDGPTAGIFNGHGLISVVISRNIWEQHEFGGIRSY